MKRKFKLGDRVKVVANSPCNIFFGRIAVIAKIEWHDYFEQWAYYLNIFHAPYFFRTHELELYKNGVDRATMRVKK